MDEMDNVKISPLFYFCRKIKVSHIKLLKNEEDYF